jgi:thymidylate synthase
MNKADKYYILNLSKIMSEGSWDENPRPKYSDGTPAHSKFITQVFEEYDISKGEFPITTLRNTAIKTGIKEILWIYQKQTSSLEVARDLGINWWEEWNIGDNSIGQRYGATIKRYDLMNKLLDGLVNDPFGRRHIISMYQYVDLEETNGLFPCAYETIWSVRKVGKDKVLDMTLIQRSSDYLVAGYINKIQYLALQMMVAGHCGYKVGKFCHLVQNLHIYDRHFDGATELLNRTPLETDLPYIELLENKNFYDYTIEDFKVINVDIIIKINSQLELAI